MHILANSDSERDQALKLLVRDAVTARSEEIFGTYDAIDDVLADMPAVQDKLCPVARETLDANGCDLPVTAVWGRESYPTREYEGVRFRPAAIIRSVCKSARQRGKTGSACCFRRCACRPRRRTRR